MPRSSTNHKNLCKAMAVPRARIIIGNLKKENAFLLKTLNELARHHNDHNRIIEKFLALVHYRPSSQEFEEEGSKCVSALVPEEQRGHEEHQRNQVNMTRVTCYANEIEEIKDQLVNISARCQYLENNTAKKQETAIDVQGENATINELQLSLNYVLEKNKQWVEYDQQREHYVKSIITRMSFLEKHLQEVSEARVTERKEFLSHENKKLKKMEQYYEGLMHNASQEKAVLREHVCLLQNALTEAKRECREKQCELEEQLQRDRETENVADIRRGNEEQYLTTEAEDLQADTVAPNSALPLDRPPLPPKTRPSLSPRKSVLDESVMECPMCHAIYPASLYNELIKHLDYCQI
ncbi:hypothetical protein NL108_012830 [Boleophthalmus pectinirostris]|uniref:centrosomal protein of 55 kDa-like n=1 Tax=Boleophthalmus pectinirostris TaxID=150288 RepID=UPI00243293FE|nr:centrosomal protein of 55 kDa-like [Boleophthalmus pectinirostris]KAJ0067110.1 hypothetical protein NL108_012830 [Boleophthalmus pectinirostris]